MSLINYYIGIDPGTNQSGLAIIDKDHNVIDKALDKNQKILQLCVELPDSIKKEAVLGVEMVTNQGSVVGRSTHMTVFWSGRFVQAWNAHHELVLRHYIKMNLCGSTRVKDRDIVQALCERYGGERKELVGTKKNPGPLHGMKSHIWQALATAVTTADITQRKFQHENTRLGQTGN